MSAVIDESVDTFLSRLLARPEGTQSLRSIQARALMELYEHGGLFGPIPVGEGKTLVAFLAPAVLRAERPLLLVPSSVYPQTCAMYTEYARHWRLPNIQILTYGLLSRESGEEALFEAHPDLLICDEAHYLRAKDAARTRRVLRYMAQNPDTRFVALSGTMTNQSLRDYAHLLWLAVRNHCFLPRDRYLFDSWCRILDSREQPMRSDFYAVESLCPDHGHNRETVRKAYQDRLRGCPGVVCGEPGRLGTSLRLVWFKPRWGSEKAYQRVEETGMRPDGMVLADPVSVWRCLRQVALGFYYKWSWPKGEEDIPWVLARNAWAREVRSELAFHAGPGYETEHQVYRAVEALPADQRAACSLGQAWNAWTEAMTRPGPETVSVWLETETLGNIIQAFRREPVILWYWSQAVADELERQGVTVCRAGQRPPVFDADLPRLLGLSLAHATGWNLQRYHRSIVLEPPSNGQQWEQLIGRTHRWGQEADTVFVYVPDHAPLYRAAVAKARKDARYVEQTKGMAQRLCYADYCEGENEE